MLHYCQKSIWTIVQTAGGKLFEDMPWYRFSRQVANMDLPLEQICNIYNTIADCAKLKSLRPIWVLKTSAYRTSALLKLHLG